MVRLSHVEPKVSGWNPASYPFFFPSVFLFCFSFLFCFDCLFVLLLFLKYIPSRAKIVYLRINNLNFYRFLRLKFLFYCNIFYKPKTVATCRTHAVTAMRCVYIVYETRSGTEKRCSHNLHSGHPAWWSADTAVLFPE